MRVDCVYSPVCQMWVNQIVDTGGHYVHRCGKCEHYLERREVVKSISSNTQAVKKFLEGVNPYEM